MNDTNTGLPEHGPVVTRRERGAVTFDATQSPYSAGGYTGYATAGDVILPEADRQLYKFLSSSGQSPHQSWSGWSLPTLNKDGSWKPGEWVEEPGDLVTCQKGLHLAYIGETHRYGDQYGETRHFNPQWESHRCFIAEVDGPVLFSPGNQKYVAHRVRLVEEVLAWPKYMSERSGRRFPTYTEQMRITEWGFRRDWPHFLTYLRKAGFRPMATRLAAAGDTNEDRRDAINSELKRIQRTIAIAKAQHGVDEAKRLLAWTKNTNPHKGFYKKQPFRANRATQRLNKQLAGLGSMHSGTPSAIAAHRLGYSDTELWNTERGRKVRGSDRYKKILTAEEAAHLAFIETMKAERPPSISFDDIFPPRKDEA